MMFYHIFFRAAEEQEHWVRIVGAFKKMPKCENYDRWDFHYFYTMKSPWVGDFRAKYKLIM
jgi:hypothetical protein